MIEPTTRNIITPHKPLEQHKVDQDIFNVNTTTIIKSATKYISDKTPVRSTNANIHIVSSTKKGKTLPRGR